MATARSLGLLLCAAAALALAACGGGEGERAAEAPPAPPAPQPAAPAPPPPAAPSPAPPPAAPQPPAVRPFSWEAAGAFVWHETDVDPELLGRALRDNGFGWVVVSLHDGAAEDPVEGDWVGRFRRASGLPVGGWGVLRAEPEREAELAGALIGRYGLDFYVANAEAEYEYSGPGGPSPERYERSRRFVEAFRRAAPSVPAALSSYCRPDMHDIDWKAWREAAFAFLPQAYVNDFGGEAAPALCVWAAQNVFPRALVHPTIGMHPGQRRPLRAAVYTRLLERAGTLGFSVYLAETRMTDDEWRAFGAAIPGLRIAR